ncbi:tripartite tricarboxylate transporter TctB family protein [Falsiroseomonas sp. HW251]|uniref:tripartite tricarboxylate transporter TctB family protein n=1 Tax=Falsiroseomonas sp. HW251 TaxID=3390998 RepID=UPI003D30F609
MTAARRFDIDVFPGLALAALGSFVTWRSLDWELLGEDGPGPGFFPLGYGVLMVGLSLLLVVRAVMRPAPGGEADWTGHARALLTWAAFAGTAFAMQWVGFFAGFAILSAFVAAFVFRRGLTQSVLVGLACAAGFWLVFDALMSVGLPTGPWGF